MNTWDFSVQKLCYKHHISRSAGMAFLPPSDGGNLPQRSSKFCSFTLHCQQVLGCTVRGAEWLCPGTRGSLRVGVLWASAVSPQGPSMFEMLLHWALLRAPRVSATTQWGAPGPSLLPGEGTPSRSPRQWVGTQLLEPSLPAWLIVRHWDWKLGWDLNQAL